MGISQLEKKRVIDDLISILENATLKGNLLVSYPPDINEGLSPSFFSSVVRTYRDWKKENQSDIRLKIKEINKWICNFNRVVDDDVIDTTTILIDVSLPIWYRLELEKALKGRFKNETNGDIIFLAMFLYCKEKLRLELTEVTEVVISQSNYYPDDSKYYPDYPVLVDNSPLIINRNELKEYLSETQWIEFKGFFKESYL